MKVVGWHECAAQLAAEEPVRCTKIMEELVSERLGRKWRRVLSVWEECSRDWNETLYRMTAYAMGAPRHKSQFELLARRVSYLMCLKERDSQSRVEALLLGASGLMTGEYYDDYHLRLQADYEYLCNKYGLVALKSKEWNSGSTRPAGSPVVRIVQMATLLAKPDYSIDALLGLRGIEDVRRFFAIEPSDYWQKRLAADGNGAGVGRLGIDKVYMLAINLVVPMQMAYAEVMNKNELRQRAIALLEEVPAERNRLVGRWTGCGVKCSSGFDSQALVELSTMCDEGRCGVCPLGKLIKKA